MKIVAMQPILYESRQYKPGETIICTDNALIDLWVKNKAVKVYGAPAVEMAQPPTIPNVDDQNGDKSPDTPTGSVETAVTTETPTPTTDQPKPPQLGRSRRGGAAKPPAKADNGGGDAQPPPTPNHDDISDGDSSPDTPMDSVETAQGGAAQ